MTDFNPCNWVGHPHLRELYLPVALVKNTVSYVLQKSGLYRNMKCE
jgi:hypothetical protein